MFSFLTGGSEQTPQEDQNSGKNYVNVLIERLKSSHLIDDRRDAIRGLKALSRRYKSEVAELGLDTLLIALKNDINDNELVGYCLDILYNLVETEVSESRNGDIADVQKLNANQLEEFTALLLNNCEALSPPDSAVSIALDLLQTFDFNVRFPAIKLITQLLRLKPNDMQNIIMSKPLGISSLVDIIQDQMEPVRNEGILALIELTKDSPAIQKIVVFENTYEHLLNIIQNEGYSDGYVIVADCLTLMLQLLLDNTSNIGFFRENNTYIPRLVSFFDLSHTGMPTPIGEEHEGTPQIEWSAQRITNVILMLSVIRSLVAPTLPVNECKACQDAIKRSGLYSQLSSMLMAHGVPAQVLAETICTVGDCARGNQNNQDYLMTLAANAFQPPRPLITVLLMSMVNESQPIVLRSAILYCFQALY